MLSSTHQLMLFSYQSVTLVPAERITFGVFLNGFSLALILHPTIRLLDSVSHDRDPLESSFLDGEPSFLVGFLSRIRERELLRLTTTISSTKRCRAKDGTASYAEEDMEKTHGDMICLGRRSSGSRKIHVARGYHYRILSPSRLKVSINNNGDASLLITFRVLSDLACASQVLVDASQRISRAKCCKYVVGFGYLFVSRNSRVYLRPRCLWEVGGYGKHGNQSQHNWIRHGHEKKRDNTVYQREAMLRWGRKSSTPRCLKRDTTTNNPHEQVCHLRPRVYV